MVKHHRETGPQDEANAEIAVEDTSHGPLGFPSEVFRGSQLRWVTADEEAFTMVTTLLRLIYLLWSGIRVYTQHRSLTYIVPTWGHASRRFSKRLATPCLENWKMAVYQDD